VVGGGGGGIHECKVAAIFQFCLTFSKNKKKIKERKSVFVNQ